MTTKHYPQLTAMQKFDIAELALQFTAQGDFELDRDDFESNEDFISMMKFATEHEEIIREVWSTIIDRIVETL